MDRVMRCSRVGRRVGVGLVSSTKFAFPLLEKCLNGTLTDSSAASRSLTADHSRQSSLSHRPLLSGRLLTGWRRKGFVRIRRESSNSHCQCIAAGNTGISNSVPRFQTGYRGEIDRERIDTPGSNGAIVSEMKGRDPGQRSLTHAAECSGNVGQGWRVGGVTRGASTNWAIVQWDPLRSSIAVDVNGVRSPSLGSLGLVRPITQAWTMPGARHLSFSGGRKGDEFDNESGEGRKGSPASAEVDGAQSVGGGGPSTTGPAAGPTSTAAASGDHSPRNTTITSTEEAGKSADDTKPVVLETAENLWTGLLETAESIRVWLALKIYRTTIERNFDLMEFLEGVQHAYLMVNSLFAKADFSTMKEMVAPRIVRAFEETIAHYKKEGVRMEHGVDTVEDVRLVKIWFVSNAADDFELKDIAPSIEGYHNDKWLVFAVRLRSQDRCRLYDEATGRLISHTVDRRGHTWKFARQLPEGSLLPVSELESRWYLIDFTFTD